jgi:hypothetical protein
MIRNIFRLTPKSLESTVYEILLWIDIFKRADLKVIQIVLDFCLHQKYYKPQ